LEEVLVEEQEVVLVVDLAAAVVVAEEVEVEAVELESGTIEYHCCR
jgi:hypothetical protein